MYQKVDTNLNFVDREKKVEEFWKENHIFEKSMENRKEGETYTFYDGPPTANGKPHIGHVLTRVIKDMIPRYRTMKGYMVPRKAGWDTHGLPVELEVEKKLGLDGKEQIEEYGMEPFIKQCKESVWKYKGMWEDFSSTVGFWADMEHPYVTYYDDYIESEWWALKEIWNKKLLYKGFKIVPYCPRCGTPLSAQEVSQGYKTVKERSAVVRFKVVGEDVPEGYMGLDIGPKTVELFAKELEGAKTVIWNGPMGVFEMPKFAEGTKAVCSMLANLKDANTIIGGGDSAAAVKQLGFADKVSHISTGGGASLEYMEGKVLPGIAAINDK